MTNVVAHFLPFFLPQPTIHIHYTHTASATTFLTSKCELKVVFFFSVSTHLPWPPPPLHPNANWRWFSFLVSMYLLWLPPLLLPNASQRFQCICHIYHPQLTRWFFQHFSTFATTTSLTSNCKLEVALLSISMCLLPPPPPPLHSMWARGGLLVVLMHLFLRAIATHGSMSLFSFLNSLKSHITEDNTIFHVHFSTGLKYMDSPKLVTSFTATPKCC